MATPLEDVEDVTEKRRAGDVVELHHDVSHAAKERFKRRQYLGFTTLDVELEEVDAILDIRKD